MNPGERIKSLRKEKGLTQAELAEQSGLSIRTMQRIENKEVNPSAYSLKMLSKALEVDLEEMSMEKAFPNYLIILDLSLKVPNKLVIRPMCPTIAKTMSGYLREMKNGELNG